MTETEVRMKDEDLNREAAKAASFYMKKVGLTHLGQTDRLNVLNYLAHGFAMGVRWNEEKLGVKK